jgi:hypothetical protein
MPGKMARSDPRPSVRVTGGVGSGQHLVSVLQEGRKNANIDARLGFIRRISVKRDFRTSKGVRSCYQTGLLLGHQGTLANGTRRGAYSPAGSTASA